MTIVPHFYFKTVINEMLITLNSISLIFFTLHISFLKKLGNMCRSLNLCHFQLNPISKLKLEQRQISTLVLPLLSSQIQGPYKKSS